MDTKRFDRLVHVGGYVVLVACTWRYLWWSGLVPGALPVVGAAAAFGVLYAVARRHVVLLLVGWAGLTLLAATFTWLAVPLFFLVLRAFSTRVALAVVVAMTAFAAIEGTLHARQAWDPSPAVAPVAIAVLAFLLFQQLHETGKLAERERLAREIHDTLAQGLSSMHLLLQAADQEWEAAPGQARDHVRQAAAVAQDNLAEARRFVHDLAPPALDDASLPEALRRIGGDAVVTVESAPGEGTVVAVSVPVRSEP